MARKIFVLSALLISGCAAPVPRPAFYAPIRRMVSATNFIPSHFEAVVLWNYAPGFTNFCWMLQSSSNLVDWVDMPGACATDPLTAYATNGSGFFRLKGAPFTP